MSPPPRHSSHTGPTESWRNVLIRHWYRDIKPKGTTERETGRCENIVGVKNRVMGHELLEEMYIVAA